jgi:hypothetical protein
MPGRIADEPHVPKEETPTVIRLEVLTMTKDPVIPRSIVACVDKEDGAVFRLGAASRMIGPTVVDTSHVMVGAGCEDWGVCVYLSVADARRLHRELGVLLTGLKDQA